MKLFEIVSTAMGLEHLAGKMIERVLGEYREQIIEISKKHNIDLKILPSNEAIRPRIDIKNKSSAAWTRFYPGSPLPTKDLLAMLNGQTSIIFKVFILFEVMIKSKLYPKEIEKIFENELESPHNDVNLGFKRGNLDLHSLHSDSSSLIKRPPPSEETEKKFFFLISDMSIGRREAMSIWHDDKRLGTRRWLSDRE